MATRLQSIQTRQAETPSPFSSLLEARTRRRTRANRKTRRFYATVERACMCARWLCLPSDSPRSAFLFLRQRLCACLVCLLVRIVSLPYLAVPAAACSRIATTSRATNRRALSFFWDVRLVRRASRAGEAAQMHGSPRSAAGARVHDGLAACCRRARSFRCIGSSPSILVNP